MKKIIILLFVVTSSYCQTSKNVKYPTVELGISDWMVENLKVTKFNNGDPIKLAKTDEEWKKCSEQKIPAYCYSNEKCIGCEKEILYNYYVLIDKRGILPAGFDFPKDNDFKALDQEFSLTPDKVKSFNFKSVGGRDIKNGYGYFSGSATFWFKDSNYLEFVEMEMGLSYGISSRDFNNKCPNNFPLDCDGKWNNFESYDSIGGSKIGNGMSIRLIKK
jgi:uncharacterized protein (TIGR02145 family)